MAHPGAEWYYAVKNYTGTSEEQLSVVAGEPLHLLDDSDNEWWYAISPRTEQAGYIPALFIESTQSRIGRVNAVKNKKLLMPSIDDTNSTTTCSHKKTIQFAAENQVHVFDDDSIEESLSGTLQRQDSDLYSAHGLIRVYAGIWDLELTYKVIKIGYNTTTEEVIRTSVSKFMQLKNPEAAAPEVLPQTTVDAYSLFLNNAGEERKLAPDECPLKELDRLGLEEEQRKLVKFQLKKAVEMDGTPIRVYSEENLFKTIIVTPTTTVGDAIKSAATKFKGKPDLFSMRMVAGGKETFLQNTSNMHEILTSNKNEGNADNQKFFLSRKRLSVDSVDQGVLRVYGGPLDLDVAYRAFFVDVSTTAEQVVALTLEKYNSRDSPKDYNLSMQISGNETTERTLEKSEKPLEILRNFEEKNPSGGDSLKFLLKKAGAIPKTSMPTIKLTKIPVRIYCDFVNKGGAPTFKPVLVSEAMTTAAVVFLAFEKFNIKSNLTIQDYTLVLINEETGAKRQLLADEFPLIVKNEVGKKVAFHLTKSFGQSDHFPIRVYGNRIWPGERFKTIFITKHQTANDAIGLALGKFKYQGATTAMFEIIKVNSDGSDIPDEKGAEGDALPFKERAEDYALIKKAGYQDVPVSTVHEPIAVSDIDATAADVRKLLASDAILNVGDENLADVDVGDLDSAFAKITDNISHLLANYGE